MIYRSKAPLRIDFADGVPMSVPIRIYRGVMTEQDLRTIHRKMLQEIGRGWLINRSDISLYGDR